MKNLRDLLTQAIFLAVLLGLSSRPALSEEFSFTNISTAGSGCPEGTTDVVKTPDGKAASVLFNEMLVEVPQFDGDNENDEESDDHRSPMSRFNSQISHKVCNISAFAKIPAGEKVDYLEVSVDFRGTTFMDPGTQALFHSQMVSWNGPQRVSRRAKDMIVRKVWRAGAVDEDWVLSNTKKINIQSNCSSRGDKDIKFALKNILKAGIKRGHHQSEVSALLTLDSADFAGKLSLKVYTSKCSGHSGGGNSGGGNNGGGRVRPPRPPRPPRTVRCPRGTVFNSRIGRCLRTRGPRTYRGR